MTWDGYMKFNLHLCVASPIYMPVLEENTTRKGVENRFFILIVFTLGRILRSWSSGEDTTYSFLYLPDEILSRTCPRALVKCDMLESFLCY